MDGREEFLLDIRRARIDLAKGTYQNRGREVVILARLDFGGAPHRNPDGEEIGSPHIHLYREGFGDKWAFPIPSEPGQPVANARTFHAVLQHRGTALHPERAVHMIDEVQSLLDRYLLWLRDRTSLREIGDCIEITTPYLDRHNDCLQIYAKRTNGGFVLTDDGYTLEDLEQSGCKINTSKRQALFKMTLNGFGVQINTNALEVKASTDNFALQKHNLVQAMLAVNDLFYLAAPTIANLFYEDVVAWLDLSDIRYTPSVKFTGKSGYDHQFDFVIPKSRVQPERVLRTISRPNRNTAEAIAFSWIDTREVRSPDSRAYAILNDTDQPVSENVLEAIRAITKFIRFRGQAETRCVRNSLRDTLSFNRIRRRTGSPRLARNTVPAGQSPTGPTSLPTH